MGDDLLRVLLPVGERGAGIEHQELDDQRERVRQRQKQVHAVLLAHQLLRLQRRSDRTVIAVRQLARLRRPSRPRRVEHQAPGLRRDAGDALLKRGLCPPSPPLAQRSKRDRVPVGVRRVDHDHELQLRQVRRNGADLRQLLGVLYEHRPSPGVTQHVVALLRRVRLIDRHDNRAGGKRRKTRIGPFRPRVRQDRNPVSRLNPQIDEPKRQLPHHLVEPLVRDLNPLAVNLVRERRLAAVSCRRQPDQVSHRPRARAHPPMLHPVAPFRFAQARDSRGRPSSSGPRGTSAAPCRPLSAFVVGRCAKRPPANAPPLSRAPAPLAARERSNASRGCISAWAPAERPRRQASHRRGAGRTKRGTDMQSARRRRPPRAPGTQHRAPIASCSRASRAPPVALGLRYPLHRRLPSVDDPAAVRRNYLPAAGSPHQTGCLIPMSRRPESGILGSLR